MVPLARLCLLSPRSESRSPAAAGETNSRPVPVPPAGEPFRSPLRIRLLCQLVPASSRRLRRASFFVRTKKEAKEKRQGGPILRRSPRTPSPTPKGPRPLGTPLDERRGFTGDERRRNSLRRFAPAPSERELVELRRGRWTRAKSLDIAKFPLYNNLLFTPAGAAPGT